ncbi:L-arabinonate dehydratase [Rubrivivax gelatinosus]|uniref:Dihydroxy-acid dehydratase n=1 Tax=Rubrivivax gelatinosus TaxID=28068 RepID=A0A4R2MAQ1_RUBGE|nr:L-arabinonate dehydratase [Rubrivivax gelatinosus]MBK1689081.1 dihydroxy-acid dehydratase [Rubrivivax gelatinosus]TCP03560.1 dihydroxy-acid dehydratase [Rubrivivax gelatinosus]
MRRSLDQLRSQRWFASDDIRGFAHRQRMQQQGLAREEFMGRPVIGILNTWSDLSPCHAHLRERAQAIRRGVLQAGGVALELPALSLGEVMVKPTTMLYRNLLAMEAEELIRSLPLDGVVLLGGCDKTTPGLVMGALSMDVPALFCPAGPMLNDRHRGQTVGAGTHTKKYWEQYTVGAIDRAEWTQLEERMTRTPGTCNTMGTASTMTAIVEAMGLALPGSTSIPAMDAGHSRMAWACGRRIVEMVWEDLRPSRLLTRSSFLNGVAAWMALGGSTNAAVHLPAMAGRAGIRLGLDDFDTMARRIPVLANLFPAGDRLMEDFHYAGGLPALLQRIAAHLDLDAATCTGRTLGAEIAGCHSLDDEVIRPLERPVVAASPDLPEAGQALAVLRGNLAPDGAVIKPSAATPALMRHTGPALVFDSNAEMLAAINDPALEVDENSVLVLRNGGPVGGPGMPEWGNLPLPKKLLQRGVRDMLRLSDARMSGTHYGSCVLHISPEAAIGGPLALVQSGDLIRIDVPARRLDLLVPEAELAERRRAWTPPPPSYARGYTRLFQREVTQAHLGCDFDVLAGNAATPEPPIF